MMPTAVLHRLPDGRWRVTNAPEDWTDDGRDYPAPNPSDAVYEFEPDAIRDYLERTTPRDPDDIAGPDDDEDVDDDLAGWGSGGGRGR